MVAQVNPHFWKGKRVFLTGHTGFKGSWLSLWLQSLGAIIKGYALAPPTTPALFNEARVGEEMVSDLGDIRDLDRLRNSMVSFSPDILIHMAAQPLVRQSYREPVETYATNVMGTVHVLEAARQCPNLQVVVNVTTDKCYENREWVWGYREDEPMGGHDPYSNSKGCVELITNAYRKSFFSKLKGAAVSSARAGNVIGGGDWAQDRLIPDTLRAFELGQPVIIRNAQAIRPWQHVLEPLSGYLVLAERLWGQGHEFAEGWNFGPRDEDVKSVSWILNRLVDLWGDGAKWIVEEDSEFHEANTLKLDISKAQSRLGWTPTWKLHNTLLKITNWHRARLSGESVRDLCFKDISEYMADMSSKGGN